MKQFLTERKQSSFSALNLNHLKINKNYNLFYCTVFHVSLVSRKDKPLLNKLAVGLDRTSHRVIKDWKGLACAKEINAPHDVWLRCGINSVKSCTQLLFNVLTAEFMETTLEDMINALTSVRRNDVKRIITNCYRSMFFFYVYYNLFICPV